ncbi:hypothetical protein [Pseudomonas sp. I2]|uniref:hypothetical protein n=1 Tax=Pseudomonas sp. I2 TaxID=1338438 RepID=UPI0034D78F2D
MKVIAIERGYYGGRIREPQDAGGEPFDIISEKHLGKWMEPQGWKPAGSSKPEASASGGQGGTTPAYTAKHNGGGRHIVIDASGKKVGDFVGANREEAQAEADRLIAGGAPYVKPADSGAGGQGGTLAGEGAAGDEKDDPGLPDA